MVQMKSWDLIYLNKRGSDLMNDWVYYCIEPAAEGVPAEPRQSAGTRMFFGAHESA